MKCARAFTKFARMFMNNAKVSMNIAKAFIKNARISMKIATAKIRRAGIKVKCRTAKFFASLTIFVQYIERRCRSGVWGIWHSINMKRLCRFQLNAG